MKASQYLFEVIVAECLLAKNVMLTVAGHTPYRAIYGRDPPMLAEFEPTSETQLDDTSGGIPGYSRHTMRLREVAMQSMTQASAQQRLERALKSKTRVAIQQLELQSGDLVDFWRKPSTKDESGWRGPATVLNEGPTLATVKWQGQNINVRTQDLRRSLVYMTSLPRCFVAEDRDDPWELLVAFAESLPGTHLRIGWFQVPSGESNGNRTGQPVARPGRWKKTKASDEHYQMLMAMLYVAAHGIQLPGCIGGRVGTGVAHLESIKEADTSFLVWWRTGSD